MVIAALLRRLGEILVQERLTTPDVVEQALARAKTTGERVGEALVELGAVKSEDVLRALAEQQNLAYLSRDELPSPLPVVKTLSAKYLRQYTVCPVSIENGLLTVAIADPLNAVVLDDLRQFTGLAVKLVVSSAEAITEAIDRTYDGAATPLQRIVEGIEDESAGAGEEDVNHLRDMAFEAPVVRLVNLLIENAIDAEASDIHVEPFEDTFRIRYRLDGILFDQEAPPRRLQAAVTSRIKLMAEMNIAERRLPQDGRIRVTLRSRRVDIRVSTIPTVHGESIVMRLLDRSSVFLPMEKLGFAPGTLRRFEALIKRPHGILLVTGPTGSGKTTTLYGALDKINTPDRKIITVEDPVEYQLKGVNQIHVKPKIGLTFATGLRHIVRQDPDVILIGEIRALETAEIAIQAALTGHLDGDLRRLEVADLADEDHVRVLPNDVPEPRGEREADLRLHVDLVDALELVLDRVLDGDDLPVGRVDLVERAVERRRLAGARRPGDEQDPVGALDERLEPPERARREAELLHREEHARAVEEPHDDGLAVHGRDRRDADVHPSASERHADAPVLGQPPLGDVHLCHELDARGHRGLQPPRRRLLVEQDAVEAVADSERVLEGLDVDVRGLGIDGVLDQEVHEPDDRRLERHVAEVVDVLLARAGTLVLDALDDPLERRGRAVVRPVDGLSDRLRGADDHLHPEPRELAEIVQDDRVQRVGDGDGQEAVLDADGAHRVLTEVLRREGLDDGERRRELVAGQVGEILLFGERAQYVLALDGAELHERLAHALTGRLCAGERLLDNVRSGQPFLD